MLNDLVCSFNEEKGKGFRLKMKKSEEKLQQDILLT